MGWGLANADVIRGVSSILTVADRGEGGKIYQNLADVICERSLSNTSSGAGVLPLELLIENDSDRNFLSQKIVIVFLGNTFLHVHAILFIVIGKYFPGFRSLHLPLDTRFWTLWLSPCNAISEGRPTP